MKRFDTPAPITVTASLVIADLRLIATDRSDTVVDVSPTDSARAADTRAAEQTRVDYLDGQLIIKAPRQDTWSLVSKPGSIGVTIELPAGSRLTADSEICALTAKGCLGDCRNQVSVGDIPLAQTGSLHASSYGRIDPNRITGRAENTKSGTVGILVIDAETT